MSVETRRLSDGQTVFRVRVRRRGLGISETFSSRGEAIAYEAQVLAAFERGGEIPRRVLASPTITHRKTIEDACREYVRGLMSGQIRARGGHGYKPSTVRGVENRLRLYVVKRIGALRAAELRRADVRQLVEEVALERSAATAGNVRDCLRLVLQRQVDLEVIDSNPAVRVPAPASDGVAPRFLTPGEADGLQQAADRHQNPLIGPLVACGLGLGLRLGELQ